MALSLAQDAIALLIDLAERGEIDPWDVKVIDVIDRFLSELAPSTELKETYEASLSQSGQAFLYASMLVLLKADSLTQAEAEAEATDELDELADVFEVGEADLSPLPPNLERRLRRRSASPPLQRRRVTLTDLIEQLQTIATALENPSPRSRLRRPRPQSRSQAVRAIAQLAHQENLSEMATALDQFFAENWVRLRPEQDWVDFDLLLEFWTASQAPPADGLVHGVNHDRVGIFWALLLLSAQSKVELVQDEFYRDLKVRPLLSELAIAPEA